MRSQSDCFDVFLAVVVDVNLIVYVKLTVNLRLLVMEVDFGWWGVVSNPTQS